MICRVCLRKNMQVQYKLNLCYIDLIKTITDVKMKVNDIVCCFCLTTLRKIQKFIDTVKDVDSILKLISIKTEEDDNEANLLYNLSVSTTRNISFECSMYETYVSNIREELENKAVKDSLKIPEIKDEPEDNNIESETDSEDDIPLIAKLNEQEEKEHKEQKDEPRQVSCSGIDKETNSEDDVPLITLAVARKENTKTLDESTKKNDVRFDNILQRTSCTEDNKVITELSSEEVVEKNKTRKRENSLEENEKLRKKIKAINANIIRELNDVGTICASKTLFSCDICAFTAKSKNNLKIHLRLHTGEKPFSCNICSCKFSKSDHLARHFRIHTGEKPFSCNICSFKCSRKENLAKHLRTHTGEKPFSCNICSHKFSQRYSLSDHLRTHTGEKPFSCNICSHKFSRMHNLTQHLRTHTGEKPFSCNICSHKFSQKSSLSNHLRLHTGEKPFSCNICSHKFSHMGNLTKHLRTHTGEKPFSCNICSYKCSEKSNLAHHVSRIHKGEKPFSCNICSHKCSEKGNLTKHLRTHKQ